MLPNPFVEFFQHPVAVFAALAYTLLLLGATVALAGIMWSTLLHLSNVWDKRDVNGKFGPQWTYVPPMGAFWRVAGLLFLGAVEALLLGALVWIVT